MNTYKTLIKRELWEYRGSFVILPAILAAVLVVMMFGAMQSFDKWDINIAVDSQSTHSTASHSSSERHIELELDDGNLTIVEDHTGEYDSLFSSNEKTIYTGLQGLHGVFLVEAWLIVLFYLLNTLFADRRDRSILFWKSMPISETQQVIIKCFVGAIMVPAMMTLVSWFVQLVFVVLAIVVASDLQLEPMKTIWPNIQLLSTFLSQLAMTLVISLWALPICAWLMLASAFAKRSPFLMATVPLIAVVAIEALIFDSHYISQWIVDHFPSLGENYLLTGRLDMALLIDMMNLASGALLAAAMLAVTIWLRNHRFEI